MHNGHELSGRDAARVMRCMDRTLHDVRERYRANAPSGFASAAYGGDVVDLAPTPLEALCAAEDQAKAEALADALCMAQRALDLDQMPDALAERIKDLVFEQFASYERQLIDFFFADGPHPLLVIRRLVAYAKTKRASLVWDMGVRQLGRLLGESHGSMALRCKMLFRGIKVGWHKGADAVEEFRAAATGNANRRGGEKYLSRLEQTGMRGVGKATKGKKYGKKIK